METDAPGLEVYQLRIALREISPAIWRRVLVRSDSTIAELHYTIQIVMGWSDVHLNRFVINGKEYGVCHSGGVGFEDDADEVRLAEFRFRDRERFVYEYDLGREWLHDVRVERKIPFDPKRAYPRCIGGRRAGPPEDCDGPWGFYALEDRCNAVHVAERYHEISEDPEASVDDHGLELLLLARWADRDHFDRRAVNRRLSQYASGSDEWAWV